VADDFPPHWPCRSQASAKGAVTTPSPRRGEGRAAQQHAEHCLENQAAIGPEWEGRGPELLWTATPAMPW